MFGEVFTVICALLGIVGLIFLTYFAARWLNRRFSTGGFGTKERTLKIRECVGIAQDKQLMIITVGKKNMLIGVTAGSVNKICDLDEDDLAAAETDGVPPENGFMQSFKKALAERKQNTAGSEDPEGKKDERNESEDF